MQYKKTGITVSDVARVLIGKGVDRKKCNEEQKGLPVIVGASTIDDGGLEVSRWIENPSPNGGRKATGLKRVSFSVSCQPEELEELKKLAAASGKTTSRFLLDLAFGR